jgi:predicted DNA-binding transcriptional regulator AlpA
VSRVPFAIIPPANASLPRAVRYVGSSPIDESFTIKEFCAAQKISRAFFYKLDAQDKAPQTYQIGSNRRISRDAYVAWRAARETQAAT